MTSAAWSSAQLARVDSADELEIAVQRADGTFARWTPVWVVSYDEQVFVRTWHRRGTGWFGRVLDSRRARIRLPGVEVDVVVEDVGSDATAELRVGVDGAYRVKYGRYGVATVDRMVADDAAAATLRLVPASAGDR